MPEIQKVSESKEPGYSVIVCQNDLKVTSQAIKKSPYTNNLKIHNKHLFTKIVCLFLIISILAVSTPAAPKIIVGKAGEVSQDIRFAFLSFNLAATIPNWFAALFATTETTTSPSNPTRIEIFPGSVSIEQGEQIVFSAVGYDEENAPVSGIDFDWQYADTGRGLVSHPMRDGKFLARVPGTFTITTQAGGQQAQVIVTVTGSAANNLIQPDPEKSTATIVSSRSSKVSKDNKIPTSETEKAESGDKNARINTENNQNLLPGEGEWNGGNWGSSDDPGNLPGNPPGHPADDGAGNGNFQLSAPVISLPGRGIDLALSLNYNSRLWNKSGNELTFDIDRGFPAPGWSLGFGKIMDMGNGNGGMLVDADGTRHSYTGLNFPGYGGSEVFRGYTTDGKFINYNAYRDSVELTRAEAYLPNGTFIEYNAKGNGAVYPTSIRDAQGNTIIITYRNNVGPSIETVTDTLGRVITFNYDSLGRLVSATAPRMLGQGIIYGTAKSRTLFNIHYRSLTLNYSFASGITPMVRNNPVWVIDSIQYPATNTGYWFGGADPNHPDYANYYSSYGMLTKVEEQRGMSLIPGSEEQGVITPGQMSKRAIYNYPLTTANETDRTNGGNLSDAPTYTTLKESWDGRDVEEDAVTTYAINNADSHWDGAANVASRTITVTQPNGAISKQYSYRGTNSWKEGLVFADETIIMNGSTPTVVSSSLVSWQLGDYEAPRPGWAEITDENGKKVKTVYDYTNGIFNQILRSCDYDHNGVKLRCATATYENSQAYKGTWASINTQSGIAWYFNGGRHIFSLPLITKVENPDGTVASRTDYEYDNYTSQQLVNTSGVIQHESTHDPYTTDTREEQGECLQWDDPQQQNYCVEWDYIDVPVYDSATDKRGNITKTTTYSDAANSSGPIFETQSYDITGNLRTASTSCCEQTSIEFDDLTQYAYPISQTRGSADPNSPYRMTTSSVFDGRTGLIKQQTDANGRTSTINYNPDTLRPASSISSTGASSAFSYDDTAMTITEEVHESNNDPAGKTVKYLNGIGLTRREESLGENNVILGIVETKYTKYAEEWKQSRPYITGDTPQWTERIYDLQGRLIKIVGPDGSETKAFYNETTRPDAASNLIGNTIRVADAWGRERWGRYDQQGRLAEVVEPNPDRAANPSGSIFATGSLMTKYTQDTLGRLTKTEQGSQIREFKFDSLGRLTRQKLAEQTATLNDAGAFVGAGGTGTKWSEAFFYDMRSNLTQKTDPRGVRTYYSYQINGADDPLNRLQSVVYDLSGPLEANLTIHAAAAVTYSYMTTGDKSRLSQIRTAGLLTEDFIYDSESRVRDYTQTVDYRENYPMTVSYFYDSLDRIDEVWYPKQYGLQGNPQDGPRKIIKHDYDAASRLSSLKVDNTEVAGNIVYNAADQTTSIKIGAAGANQVTENYSFDQQTGLLTNQKVQNSSQTLLDLSYDYNRNNAVGSLNGKTGHLSKIINNLDQNKNREYEFDALGRLSKAKGGSTGNLWTQEYTYDRYGNRTNVTATGVAANNSPIPLDGLPSLTYNNSTNRITTAGFEYDSAGNQTRAKAEDGSWIKMQYDAANRLRVVTKDDGTGLQAFQYGSTNARLMDYDPLTNQTKIIASNGGTTLAEYTEFIYIQPKWTKNYTYLGDSQLSTITPNGAGGEVTEYNHPDRLGTRTITNQSAGTSYEQATLPFGTALNAESTTTLSKRFTSYERSNNTGLDYAVNRTYDSKQGRFTQVDPIGISAASLTSPQTLNLYTYCGNDPVNHTDPSGLFFGKLFKWIGKIFNAINKILKWVVIAIAVTAVAIAIFHSGPAAAVFLKAILGFAGKYLGIKVIGPGIIKNFAGEMIGYTLSTTISVSIKAQIIAGLYAVGAIANSFTNRKNNIDEAKAFDITFTALLDAFSILQTDLKCAKFFGLTDKNGKFSKKKYKQFISKIDVDMKYNTPGPFAKTEGNQITLYGGFYIDGWFKGSPQPYSIKNPRQGRAQTILHELGHAKKVLISPDNSGYPNDPNSPGNQNEKKILDNCGDGLGKVTNTY